MNVWVCVGMCVSLAVCAGASCLGLVLLSIQAVNGQNLTLCVCLGVMCEGLLGSISSNVNEHLRRILQWQSSKPFSSICAHTQARSLMNNDWSTGCRGYSFTKQFPCFHLSPRSITLMLNGSSERLKGRQHVWNLAFGATGRILN